MSRQWRRFDENANTLLETALVLPVLLLLLAGAVDLGRACTIAIAVQAAAEAGAVYGSLNPTDITGIVAAATQSAKSWPTIAVNTPSLYCQCYDGTQQSSGCTATPTNCVSAAAYTAENIVYNVTVTTTATYVPLISYPGFSGFTLNGKASLRASQ